MSLKHLKNKILTVLTFLARVLVYIILFGLYGTAHFEKKVTVKVSTPTNVEEGYVKKHKGSNTPSQ